MIDFADGTGEAAVAFVKMSLRPAEWQPGLYGCPFHVHTESEPGERFVKAEEAGWNPA